MFGRIISKYGLATHLAVIAGLLTGLYPFLSADAYVTTFFWIIPLTLLWFFAEPSVRTGEFQHDARARIVRSFIRDPLTYLLGALVLYAGVIWMNDGIVRAFNPEAGVWAVKAPDWIFMPAGVPGAGKIPFVVLLGVFVVIQGVRLGLGLAARICFALVAASLAGLGGLAAASCACCGMPQYLNMAGVKFLTMPYLGSVFGGFLLMTVMAAAHAEARHWFFMRLLLVVGVIGNSAGLIFFAPALVSAVWLALSGIAVVFSVVWVLRNGGSASAVRYGIFLAVGVASIYLAIMSFMPPVLSSAKQAELDAGLTFTEAQQDTSKTLARIAKDMWVKNPWLGAGAGAFGVQVPFFAEKQDWEVLPNKCPYAATSYWTLIAEEGIIGCALPIVLVLVLLVFWGWRCADAWLYVRSCDERDPFIFEVPPEAWIGLVVVIPYILEGLVAPIFSLMPVWAGLLIPLAWAGASFPKAKRKKNSNG